MKLLVTLSMALVASLTCAQNDAIFHSVGWTVYFDYMQGPPVSSATLNPDGILVTDHAQQSGFSIFTFLYNFRYNVRELNDDAAISLSTTPALGFFTDLSGGGSGIGHFNIPLAVGWEYGAGSTYNSAKAKGTFIRAGWEYTIAPLFGVDERTGLEPKKSWGALSLQSGLRYYNRKNRMRELNLKYAQGASGAGTNDAGTVVDKRAWGIRFAWVFILDY